MASYDAFIKQLTNPRYLRRDLKISDIKGPRVPNIGVPRVTYKDGNIVGLDPMSTISNNENIIAGGALPLAGAVAATQLPDLIDKIDPNVLNKMMWTPAGIVLAPEVKEEAKPKIETFPSGEKQETSLITKKPEQVKTDTGFTPPTINTEIPGLKPDTGEDTSILYRREMDPEKKEKIIKTYDELKKKLERIPFVSEIANKTGIPNYTVQHYLGRLEYPLASPSTAKTVQYESYKEFGDVDKPAFSQSGVKWPDQKTKDDYREQIVNRYKFANNSVEAREKKRSGELLSNEQLAEKYDISNSVVKRINKEIVKEYDLEEKPVKGRSQTLKDRSERRQGAIKIFTDSGFEQKVGGDLGVHLGHMSDLYNRAVKAETLGYAPSEINQALGETIDSVIKNINKAQDKLIKDKPEGWKEKLEEYNIKGMNYAALAKGYKTFEVTDPDTLEKTPINVQYGKIIDPTGIYEGKSIKDIAKETNLVELNKIEKAFSQAAKGEKVRNPDLLTEENFKKLKNYKLFEINREAVLKSQSKIPASEKKQISKDIVNYRDFKFNKGGRVGLKQGGEPTGMYYQEIPDVDPEIILHKQIMNEDDPVRIAALEHRLDMYRKQLAQEEKQRQEYKQAQKDQGVRYLEDFPTQSDYFKEMGKELASATGMPYLAAKFTKGVIELPEWVVGQTYTTGKALAGQGEHKFYHPVAGEKIGLDKAIKQLEPERPTTGILNLGTTAELAGGFTDPLLIPRLGSKTVKGIGSLVSDVESGTKGVVDTSRRDLLKTGAVIAAAPVLAKFSKVKTPTKVAEAIETGVKVLPKVSGMPEWFPTLVSRIEKEGKFPFSDYAITDNVKIKELTIPPKTGKGPNETYIMTKYPDGKIEIHADIKGGAYDQPFELHYTPPKTDIHVETGEPVKYPGEFSIVEQRPRPDPSDPGRWEFDWEDVSREQALSDIDKVEQFTTGKIADPKAAEKRAAQRKSYDNTPYEDIADRYPEPNIPDYWE